MYEIPESDAAVPGDLRIRSDEQTVANVIVEVNAGVTLLSLWRDGDLTLQRRQFRPTYCVWRATC